MCLKFFLRVLLLFQPKEKKYKTIIVKKKIEKKEKPVEYEYLPQEEGDEIAFRIPKAEIGEWQCPVYRYCRIKTTGPCLHNCVIGPIVKWGNFPYVSDIFQNRRNHLWGKLKDKNYKREKSSNKTWPELTILGICVWLSGSKYWPQMKLGHWIGK